MAKPDRKAPKIEKFLEDNFGRTSAIESDKCIQCGKDAKYFRDGLSRKEYSISGMCQACQDNFFEPRGDE